jgi:hypothetical protein
VVPLQLLFANSSEHYGLAYSVDVRLKVKAKIVGANFSAQYPGADITVPSPF